MVAADSALRTLERQMNQRNLLGLVNRELMRKRDSLSAAVSEMAQLRLLKDDTLRVRPRIDSLRQAIGMYKRHLRNVSDSIQTIQARLYPETAGAGNRHCRKRIPRKPP